MSDGKRVKNAEFPAQAGRSTRVGRVGRGGKNRTRPFDLRSRKRKSGEVYLDGKSFRSNQPKDTIRAGIGYVPEDRKLQGVFLQMTSGENITMNILGRCAKAGVLDFKN